MITVSAQYSLKVSMLPVPLQGIGCDLLVENLKLGFELCVFLPGPAKHVLQRIGDVLLAHADPRSE